VLRFTSSSKRLGTIIPVSVDPRFGLNRTPKPFQSTPGRSETEPILDEETSPRRIRASVCAIPTRPLPGRRREPLLSTTNGRSATCSDAKRIGPEVDKGSSPKPPNRVRGASKTGAPREAPPLLLAEPLSLVDPVRAHFAEIAVVLKQARKARVSEEIFEVVNLAAPKALAIRALIDKEKRRRLRL